MKNAIVTVKIEALQPHPDNPNRMSKADFKKLVRHIERTGRYEPIIVRPVPSCVARDASCKTNTQNSKRNTQYEIINGHHRVEALKQLGRQTCDCVVWDVDDDETRLLLATLNQLSGKDILDKKTALLQKLNDKLKVEQLSKLLPQTASQIQRLIELNNYKLKIKSAKATTESSFAQPMVFFLSTEQKRTVEKALSLAETSEATKAKRNAEALTQIAQHFISQQ